MIERTLHQVATATGGTLVGDPELVVRHVTADSRQVDADAATLFVALHGDDADGHDYVGAATEAGAVASLVERRDALGGRAGVVVGDTWRGIGALGAAVRDAVDPAVVAITGSVGKTTTKDLIAAAVGADRPTTAAQGSFNNELGVPLTLLACTADTEALVVEIGARGVGHIASLTPWVRPDVSVVTAVAGAHLEQFGDLDTVARAKGELVEALGADGTAVLNAADHRVAAMAARTSATVLGYGEGGEVRATDVRLDRLARPTATVVTPWGDVELRVPLPGRHNLDNALAAVAAAGALGVAPEIAAAGIADAVVSRWRGELSERADGLVVCNDAYNANPTSAHAALDLLGELRPADGRAIAVLGHMAELGADEHDGHAEVGAAAAEHADLVVAVGRTGPLADAARAGGAEVLEVDDPAAAAAALLGRVGAGDVVLVKASRSAGLELVADRLLDAGVDQ